MQVWSYLKHNYIYTWHLCNKWFNLCHCTKVKIFKDWSNQGLVLLSWHNRKIASRTDWPFSTLISNIISYFFWRHSANLIQCNLYLIVYVTAVYISYNLKQTLPRKTFLKSLWSSLTLHLSTPSVFLKTYQCQIMTIMQK